MNRLLKTKIPWADYVWNPITGCEPASAGCANCYAKTIHDRFNKTPFSDIVFHPDRLEAPLNTKKPGIVFVNSMGDFFHKDVKLEWIDQCLEVMAAATQHDFVILTKRAENIEEKLYGQDGRTGDNYLMRELGGGDYLKNMWLGVSVEDQATADERIPLLLSVPAGKRIVSVEPMLGAVDLNKIELPPEIGKSCGNYLTSLSHHHDDALYGANKPLDWVICGAESGPGKRPMDIDWARSLRDQCAAADVPFFFKVDSNGNPTLDGATTRQTTGRAGC